MKPPPPLHSLPVAPSSHFFTLLPPALSLSPPSSLSSLSSPLEATKPDRDAAWAFTALQSCPVSLVPVALTSDCRCQCVVGFTLNANSTLRRSRLSCVLLRHSPLPRLGFFSALCVQFPALSTLQEAQGSSLWRVTLQLSKLWGVVGDTMPGPVCLATCFAVAWSCRLGSDSVTWAESSALHTC